MSWLFVVVFLLLLLVVVLTEPSPEHDEEANVDRETQEIQYRQAMGHKDRRRRRFGHADRRHPREFVSSSRLNSRSISSHLQLIFKLNY